MSTNEGNEEHVFEGYLNKIAYVKTPEGRFKIDWENTTGFEKPHYWDDEQTWETSWDAQRFVYFFAYPIYSVISYAGWQKLVTKCKGEPIQNYYTWRDSGKKKIIDERVTYVSATPPKKRKREDSPVPDMKIKDDIEKRNDLIRRELILREKIEQKNKEIREANEALEAMAMADQMINMIENEKTDNNKF